MPEWRWIQNVCFVEKQKQWGWLLRLCAWKRALSVFLFKSCVCCGRGRGEIVYACICVLYTWSTHTGWDHRTNLSHWPSTAFIKKGARELTRFAAGTHARTHARTRTRAPERKSKKTCLKRRSLSNYLFASTSDLDSDWCNCYYCYNTKRLVIDITRKAVR